MNKPTVAFRLALRRIAAVMAEGACTHSGDWRDESASFHTGRAERHLRLLRETDTSEDHLAHAACRLLMALELREGDSPFVWRAVEAITRAAREGVPQSIAGAPNVREQ
jgi:hypothetical protein